MTGNYRNLFAPPTGMWYGRVGWGQSQLVRAFR